MVEEKEPFNGFVKGARTEESVLNNFDFTVIEEMDPAKEERYEIAFDREAPFELRIHDPS